MTPRGYLAMERFQGYNGFLGRLRLDSLWAWVGLIASALAHTIPAFMFILAAPVGCADHVPN